MTMPLVAAAGIHPLATTNAVLNTVAAVLLVAGWVFIRRGQWRAHRAAMVAAFATSAADTQNILRMGMIVTGLGAILQANRRGPIGSGYLCPPIVAPSACNRRAASPAWGDGDVSGSQGGF